MEGGGWCRASDGKNWCHFHPNHLVIGICALCLNQRLLILAEQLQSTNSRTRTRTTRGGGRRRSRTTTPHIHDLPLKIFALITSPFLIQTKKSSSFSTNVSSSSSPSSQEESFISIKFEENGAASWEKTTSMEKYCDMTWNQNLDKINKKKEDVEGVVKAVVVVEPKEGASSLRWRKRIGQLFQLMRWKKSSAPPPPPPPPSSSKSAMENVGTKIEGAKVRHGWTRTFTKQQQQKEKKKKNKAAGLMCTES